MNKEMINEKDSLVECYENSINESERDEKTEDDFIEYLNDVAPDYESDEWILGGKRREWYAKDGLYGEAMKKYDPIAFEVGYRDWKREY